MPNQKLDTMLYDKAVIFAVKAHKNTGRRNHNSPYVIHVLEASSICETITNDQEILAAAVLHDTVEDTNTKLIDIEKKFGKRVAELVNYESDVVFDGKSLTESWKERKSIALNTLKNAPLDAKIIALGDKLSNIRAISRDVLREGEKFWKSFHNKDPKEHEWYYRGLVDALKELSDTNAYKEFKFLVDKVFDK